MKRRKPTKQDIIDELQRIQSRDGSVSMRIFKGETGWGQHWFLKYWPESGYIGACKEARAKRGAIVGVERDVFVSDEEIALRFAAAVASINRIPGIKQLAALTKTGEDTIRRDDSYEDAKRRLIRVYFTLPESKRQFPGVEAIFLDELRLEQSEGREDTKPRPPAVRQHRHEIHVPEKFISDVRSMRDQGEEEQRQLVVLFFVDILEFRRLRVRSEIQKNDVCVHNRGNKPWLVVEVKASLKSDKEKRAARRQGFDYAHRKGLRYVVISDGDFFEVYDRCAGERLSYDEMRQGSFQLTSLRSRDGDLLSLLATER
jgi:hypothetical protein